jgi:DNA-directed RNA polymerase II subunit RPB1
MNRVSPFLEAEVIEDCRREPEISMMDVSKTYAKSGCSSYHYETVSLVESDESSYAPGNIRRVIHNAIRQFRVNKGQVVRLAPGCDSKVNALLDRLIVVVGNDPLSVEARRTPPHSTGFWSTLFFPASVF